MKWSKRCDGAICGVFCVRLRFARRHFNLLQILSVTLVFAPLSAAYYVLVALRNKRSDIAWSYFKGTLRGILCLN